MANIDDLRTLAQQIKNETTVGANTANRVGTTFEKTVTELETLATAVAGEATARQTADTTEKNARQAADASLQQAISNEKAARETADASLRQAIADEATARQTADTTEKNARQAADASLQQAISNENAAREAADASLQQAIADEIASRETADASLQQAISNEKAARETALRSFYKAAGAVYNATTGYYELNGLTDITEAQMADIYSIGRGFNFGKDNDFKFAYQQLRTNLLPITSGSRSCGVYEIYNANNAVSCRYMFAYISVFEVAVVGIAKTGTEIGFYPLDASSMFVNCSNLRTVLGVLKMKYCNTVYGMFTGCSSLRTIKLSEVKINISFADSPLLYYSSLFYLVDKASNTTAITVTVHKTIYECLTGLHTTESDAKIEQEAEEVGSTASQLWSDYQTLRNDAAQLHNISFAER